VSNTTDSISPVEAIFTAFWHNGQMKIISYIAAVVAFSTLAQGTLSAALTSHSTG
jgi:hypothetical protein